MKLNKQVEELRDKIQEIEESQTEIKTAGPGSNSAKLRVCEDCGAQLNIMDHESRIADHYNGKMHIGMVETRETYLKMKETIEERRKEREEKLGSQRNMGGYGGRRESYNNRLERIYHFRTQFTFSDAIVETVTEITVIVVTVTVTGIVVTIATEAVLATGPTDEMTGTADTNETPATLATGT